MTLSACMLFAGLAFPQWTSSQLDSDGVVARPKLEDGYVEVEYPSPDEADEKITARIPLRNQSRPVLRVRVAQEDHLFRYAYELSNQPDAAQSISNWQTAIPQVHFVDEVREPAGWHHGLSESSVPSIQEALNDEMGVFLAWYPLSEPARPIAASEKLDGFSCRSALAPGLATAFVFSPWPDQGILKSLPVAAVRAVYPYLEYRYSSRMVLTAAPLHALDEARLSVAGSFRRELQKLAKGGEEAELRFALDAIQVLDEYAGLLQAGKPVEESTAALCRFVEIPASSTTEEAVVLALRFNFCVGSEIESQSQHLN